MRRLKHPRSGPFRRIAAALARRGIKIGDGANVRDLEHLADLIEVAALMNAGRRRPAPGDLDDDAAIRPEFWA